MLTEEKVGLIVPRIERHARLFEVRTHTYASAIVSSLVQVLDNFC